MLPVFLERLGYLNSQLARWSEDKHLSVRVIHIDSAKQWQGECSGFPSACLCLAQHIPPSQQFWNRSRLDTGRNGVTGGFERLADFWAQA